MPEQPTSTADGRPATEPALEVRDVVKHFHPGRSLFPSRRQTLRAVDGISFTLRARPDARDRGGERVREVHAGPDDARSGEADGRRDPAHRAASSRR